jgi:protease II
MKWIDFDGLFDEKLAQYMLENKEKHTEKQWEDVIPKLYKKFGDTYVAKVKCTPKEYYAKMTDSQLVETLSAHLQSDVPVPEFLCAEIETRGAVETLTPMLLSDNSQAAAYALNLIGDDARAYDCYFKILQSETADEDLKNDVVEIFKLHADEVKEFALSLYEKQIASEAMLEILSRIKERDERVYDLLVKAFKTDENLSMRASYLAAYGDERALPMLLKRIEDITIGFVEFQELKYAIEALGGEYDEPRDFSDDKDYIAVEAAAAKVNKNGETGN